MQSYKCNHIYICVCVPWPTLGHSQGDSLTNLMLIAAYVRIRPEGHWEPHNEVWSLIPAKRLADFELGTFQFLFQCLNKLGHSPHNTNIIKYIEYNHIYLLHPLRSLV